MAMVNKVNFVSGTQALFNSIQSKDSNSLYFITDTKRIYKGDVDVTQSVIAVTNFPANGISNKIYVHSNTLETRIYYDGVWKVLTPGFIQTLDEMKSDENKAKLATIDAIKGYIDEMLAERSANLFNDIEFDKENGWVKLSGDGEMSEKSAELTGVAHGVTYDPSNVRITIPQYGEEDLVINLPRDNFLTDAYYDKQYDFEDGQVGPAIVLVVKTDGTEESKKLAIPASAMANDYTAGKTDTISVEIDDSHKIKARLIIDANTSDGTLTIWDSVNKKLGTVGVKINNNTDEEMGESNESIPTAAVIAAAIKKAASEITGGLLTAGNENEVVISTANGIVRSGKIIGGATLSENPDANTLATEAAVLDAISWKSLA